MQAKNSNYPARHWKTLPDGRVECELCPHRCRLKEGQRGLCFVRACEKGAMVLTTYGRSSGFCIDPIEKKPLFHFLPGTPVLSFGTAGCNLRCRMCQNWSISKASEMAVLAEDASPELIVAAAKQYKCRSIAFTYNEPLIFLEYAVDVAKACHAEGIKTVAVTAGYVNPGAREDFFEHMDAVNIDLKGFTEDFYKRICGGDLHTVQETIKYLHRETKAWVEITNLVIPGENDSPDEVREMCRWIRSEMGADVPLHFSAFHPSYKMQDKPPTPSETLTMARDIARKEGLHFVYTGNVHDPEGGSTHCSACGRKIIGRDWFVLTSWHLDAGGKCSHCGAVCPGIFETKPGTWGARCMPVQL
ncbi:MAG: AmmeMemoRadiSam system radical SAM enzyme [Kiritimatiellia bacterium]